MTDSWAGVYRAVVTAVGDSRRMRVLVPAVFGANTSVWAEPCEPTQGPLPSVKDVVWVAFENGCRDFPVWMGSWRAPLVAEAADVLELPTGGTTNQALVKNSNTSGDVKWNNAYLTVRSAASSTNATGRAVLEFANDVTVTDDSTNARTNITQRHRIVRAQQVDSGGLNLAANDCLELGYLNGVAFLWADCYVDLVVRSIPWTSNLWGWQGISVQKSILDAGAAQDEWVTITPSWARTPGSERVSLEVARDASNNLRVRLRRVTVQGNTGMWTYDLIVRAPALGSGDNWTDTKAKQTAPAATTKTANVVSPVFPVGGAINQVLSKNSATDYDFKWAAAGRTRTLTVTSGNATAGSAGATDYAYIIAGAHTITLPTAVGNANRYSFKNRHSANVNIPTNSSQTIDGAAGPYVLAPNAAIEFFSDGANWVSQTIYPLDLTTADARYVNVAGDTMTGNLALTMVSAGAANDIFKMQATGSTAGTTLSMVLDAPAACWRYMHWRTAGLDRWKMGAENTAEGGAGAGSDFVLRNYDDAGAFVATVLRVTRSTGLATVFADPTAALGIATKQYVDKQGLGVLAMATGPSGQTDYQALADVSGVTVTVNLVSGRKYRVSGYGIGTQITNASTATYLYLTDTGSYLNNVRLMQAAVAINTALPGSAVFVFAATATASVTFKMQATSNQTAFRISANACQIVVEDIGT